MLPPDPFLWLEEVEGDQALDWVRAQNARTVGDLEAHPDFKAIHAEIRQIFFAKDRVPFASFYKNFFWNFWQDESHRHGLLRRTTYEEYKKSEPSWETILDIDELAKTEKENWVYQGSDRLDKDSSRHLLHLSRGGKDAAVIREFDYATKQFVTDGFVVPEAKSSVTPLDENRIIIGTEWGPDTLTDSGYPRTLKIWSRGQALSEARTLFEVEKTDLAAGAMQLRDHALKYVFFHRTVDFFNSEVFFLENLAKLEMLRKLPIPLTASILGLREGFLYVQIKEAVDAGPKKFPPNSVIRFRLAESNLESAEIIFTAGARQSIQDVDVNRDRIFVSLLDNIRSRILEIPLTAQGWQAQPLAFPDTGVIGFDLKDDQDPQDITTLSYTDHLTPPSQYRVHDEVPTENGAYRLELLKRAPARFDSTRFEVQQYFSTSRDQTQIPYFVLKRKDLPLDGTHPTILYGYGGFEVPLVPSYSSSVGKIWLERGGVYVVANIRGGGEFGPDWHEAGRKGNRQKVFDDFISVAEDLIQRGITAPSHLGIQGGSNGGLLVGATLLQRPELFNAALAQVPLLDMVRYSKLLAGASWVGEYGDPEVDEELASLLTYSPYHHIQTGARYPKPMFTTSTKDDRVHPGHARKMAARLAEQKHDFYYYENINGGHAGSANLEESAYMAALEYTYFWSRLA
jgi:prolyl oligopeptidase